ncbi:MAG: CvpA family protein [Clostridiales Family XIII bacterium]|jgi:uncharacterized membrane protein required for colicin V production|nr:CvpA family protein [Clostridiales Family XIII bacterium]
MIADILIALILLLFAFLGFKNGLARTLVRLISWVLAVIVALLSCGFLENYVKVHTLIDEYYFEKVLRICSTFYEKYTSGITEELPEPISDTVDTVGEKFVSETSQRIAGIAFAILIFIIIILFVKLLFFIVERLFSKKYNDGFVGAVDGIVGLILGFAQGAVVVFLLLALILPLSYMINESIYEAVHNTISHSFYAEYLYNNNPILRLAGGELTDLMGGDLQELIETNSPPEPPKG